MFWRRNSNGAEGTAGDGTAVVRAGEVASPPKRMVRVQLRAEMMVVVREYLVTVRVLVSTVVVVVRRAPGGGGRVEVKRDVVGMSGGPGVGATVTVTVTVVSPACFFTKTGLASADAATANRLKVLKRPILT